MTTLDQVIVKPVFTPDAKRERPGHHAFWQVRNAELTYARQLRKVAAQINDLVQAYYQQHGLSSDVPVNTNDIAELAHMLQRYGELLKPWASRVAKRMLLELAQRDARAWDLYTRQLSVGLRKEILDAPLGHVFQEAMHRQVDLITSLPLDMAEAVHKTTIESMFTGERAAALAPALRQQLLQAGLTTPGAVRARANTIARTEVSRTASVLTQTRAEYVGSEAYIWRTAEDSDVRPATWLSPAQFAKMNTRARGSHRLLNGKVIRWDTPPIAGPRGERAHAGCIYNCRCYPEPIIADRF